MDQDFEILIKRTEQKGFFKNVKGTKVTIDGQECFIEREAPLPWKIIHEHRAMVLRLDD